VPGKGYPSPACHAAGKQPKDGCKTTENDCFASSDLEAVIQPGRQKQPDNTD
jgi:hypothetical protein